MRGRPIVEWLVFVVLWLCLLAPLRVLTSRQGAPPVEAVEVSDTVSRLTWATVRFSETPARFRLTCEGRVLWEENEVAGNESEGEFMLELYRDSTDIVLEVWWDKPGGVKAVELRLEPDELEGLSRTVWERSDALEEAVTFQW